MIHVEDHAAHCRMAREIIIYLPGYPVVGDIPGSLVVGNLPGYLVVINRYLQRSIGNHDCAV